MGIKPIFDPELWARVPFHFWSLVFFVFGCMVGSFLNVCIYRMPLGLSVVSPPSHCPHCKYSIPWYLNVPLVTWLCCGANARTAARPSRRATFGVELLTGVAFLGCWLASGISRPGWRWSMACSSRGLIVATFIDFEHFIIPDEITIGGMVVGFICSLLFPALHGAESVVSAMIKSGLGLAVGGGIVYLILRAGKLLFGRQRLELPADTQIVFSETAVHLPDKDIPYEELFYRQSDVIIMHARTVELVDRGYRDVPVRLSPKRLADWRRGIRARNRAAHGGGERRDCAAARGDGFWRCEIHGGHWGVPRLAGDVLFA